MGNSRSSWNHTQIKIQPRQKAAKAAGSQRRFQADLELNGVLAGDELVAELAAFGFEGNTTRAEHALLVLREFIKEKLGKGYRVNLDLVSFFPKLSGALSTRDADPAADGLYVQGAVSARPQLRQALKDAVDAVNPLARHFIRIHNVLDTETDLFDVIETGHTLSVIGHDIPVNPKNPDEGFWLEKRAAHRGQKPKFIQRAEVLESNLTSARIIFRDPLPRGPYNLVVATRCGESHDYILRHVAHPVKVT